MYFVLIVSEHYGHQVHRVFWDLSSVLLLCFRPYLVNIPLELRRSGSFAGAQCHTMMKRLTCPTIHSYHHNNNNNNGL